jgi:molybdate transport system ATP-binding protein
MVAMASSMNSSSLVLDVRKQLRHENSPSFLLDFTGEFAPGFTILFGPSGSGKSTLLHCIAGLLAPDSGVVRLGQEILSDASRQIFTLPQRRHIAYVFQSLALFPHLSVEGNVGFGLVDLGAAEKQKRVDAILAVFQIAGLRRRKPRELSGGEKQRVALARSLVTEPRLLLLDEPLTGLDSALRSAILEDLRTWNSTQRIPVIYVTHNREEVDAIGERIVAISEGKLLGSGDPRSVLDAPGSVALAQAAGFENILQTRIIENNPSDGVTRVALSDVNCELEIPLTSAAPGETVQVAIRAGDILLAAEEPRSLSARNVLPGVIESLNERGSIVVAKVQAAANFVVHITPGAVRSLKLVEGKTVWLVVKTHSCHLVR